MKFQNILIVAATAQEIKGLMPSFSIQNGFTGHIVPENYNGHAFDILITGPGMVTTAFHLGQWLAIKHYDLVINAGIAGSFNSTIQIGEVVNVDSDCFPELGAEYGPQFIPLYSMEMAKTYLPEFIDHDGSIKNSSLPGISSIEKLVKVKGITVNTISGNEENIEHLKKMTGADIETMEGAAFFFACHSANVQCIQLRAISNHIEPRNLKNWNVDLAVNNLDETLKRILDEL